MLSNFDAFIDDIYNDISKNNNGDVATYIPQLAKVNPDLFSISICDVNGELINKGDFNIDFCIQSCSKPFSYCIAHKLLGSDYVHSKVGYEPSGQSFNAFVLNKKGLPHNPMINSGAIMVSSLIGRDKEPSDRFELVKDYYNRICGNIGNIGFDNSVFLSEQHHADRNISLAYHMRENNSFGFPITPNEINDSLNLYFQSCSILLNSKMGAVMAATLANGGTCPITSDKIFDIDTVRDCLTLMYGCGMYDYSGEFAFQVGLPAKSGVSGCILLVVPGKMGICIWSPRLDDQGNSVRGIEVCKKIANHLKLHIFHNIFEIKNDLVPQSQDNDDNEVLIQKLISFASRGDLENMKLLDNKIDFNICDYDYRTSLHLACSEGHLDIVKYLVNEKSVNIKVKDRWGNTPLSEAKKVNNIEIINFLNMTHALIMLQNKMRARIAKRLLLSSNGGL
jgi:glutaminase